MTTAFSRSRIATAIGALALALGGGQAFGAGFILQENSGSGLGNAYAGGAAASEDADTVWTNPAGMQRIKTNQVALAVNLIQPSFKFSNDNSQPALNQPLGGDGGDGGSLNVVPNLYLVVPLTKEWHFGLGINAPFGLVTEFDSSWVGRYQGVKSDIKTLNINPAISYQFGNMAVGVGANYQQIKATLTQQVNYSAALLQAAGRGGIAPGSPAFNAIFLATHGLDSFATVDGNDSAWGWNVGFEWKPDAPSRFGAAYRSAIKYHVTGNVNFDNPTVAATNLPPPLGPTIGLLVAGVNSTATVNGGVNSDIKLPAFANLSYFRQVDPTWAFMADVQWTQWSTVQDLAFNLDSGGPLESQALNFKNVWRVSVGANYRYNDQWMFRGGLAWDQSPVQDQYRTVRLPDADRVWLATGVEYRMTNPDLRFDLGAAYLWVQNGSINNIGPSLYGQPPTVAQNGLVNGTFHNSSVVVSGQVTYGF